MKERKTYFLMKVQIWNPDKQNIKDVFVSEKYDGYRCMWDGGISIGYKAKDIPWANTNKTGKEDNCTGFWTSGAKVIYAPDYFYNKMPKNIMLDGELYGGRGKFQFVQKVARDIHKSTPEFWDQLKYMVFDSPNIKIITKDSKNFYDKIETDLSNKKYKDIYPILKDIISKHDNNKINLVDQIEFNDMDEVNKFYTNVLSLDGEGIILRNKDSIWTNIRSSDIFKLKPFNDMEGIVVGFEKGKGKYTGMMGGLVLKLESGKQVEISGFTNKERELKDDWPYMFPKGTNITFKYRILTDGGIPRDARYLRERLEE